MDADPDDPTVVDVSEDGDVTLPEELQRQLGLEAPGQLLVSEEGGRGILEALPSVAELQGIHAGRYEQGEVLSHLETMNRAESE